MSWRRPFIWTCDVCRGAEEKEGFGFPGGWGYVYVSGRGVKHHCANPHCKKILTASTTTC